MRSFASLSVFISGPSLHNAGRVRSDVWKDQRPKHYAQELATLQTEANRLLSAVHHESARTQVRLAIRDLDEAHTWLKQPNFERRPSIHQIVRLIIETVTWRLNLVRDGLDKVGPDFQILG